MTNKLSHNWCFTVNNYTDDDIVNVKSLQYKYLVYGYEVGAEGTPHLQCYVELEKLSRRSAIVKAVPRAAKVEPRYQHSTAEQASNYCKKDGNYVEDGTISTARMLAGSSPKQKSIKNKDAIMVMSAPNKEDAIALARSLMPHDWLLHSTAIENSLNKLFTTPHQHRYQPSDFECPMLTEDDKKLAILLWGPSGFGKTQYALTQFKNPLLIRHMDKLKELTPLHDGLVFDDLSFTHYPPEAVIHLLDMEEDSTIHVR